MDNKCCHHDHDSGLSQSLDEVDFERGVWAAALSGDVARVEHLVNADASRANGRDSAGYTALHYASRAGHKEVARLLLDRGAGVDAVTAAGGATPLMRAAYMGRTECVKLLIERGANLLIQDSDGKSCLHKAVEGGRLECAQLLAQKCPALVSVKDLSGKVSYDYYKQDGREDEWKVVLSS